jgi:hypothetical protein
MMAAAAVLIAAVGFPLATRSRPSRERATPSVANSAPAPEAPPPVALLLTLGSSRSATPPVERALGSDTLILQLRVRMDPADVFDSYSMELRSDRGTVVWRGDSLHASAANGDLTLVGDVPAPSLSSATYELTVLGSTAGRAPEALGFAAVKIAR